MAKDNADSNTFTIQGQQHWQQLTRIYQFKWDHDRNEWLRLQQAAGHNITVITKDQLQPNPVLMAMVNTSRMTIHRDTTPL